MGELSFRDAGAEDVAALVALINEAYDVEAFFVSGPRTSVEEVEEKRRSGAFLVAEDEAGLVGCVYVDRRGERGYFGLLSVAKPLQGRGLGRRLVAKAEERLRAEGYREVEILVIDLRKELFPFYAGLGYREVGEAPFPEQFQSLRPCRFLVWRKTLA